MTVKVGINGFGRIGRNVLRASLKKGQIEIVGVNDLTSPETLAHLLKYDSVHGTLAEEVVAKENAIVVGGREIKVFSEKDPSKLPWKDLGVEIVLECTGIFRDVEKASAHIKAGAKKVIISAPAKGECTTIVMGVNHTSYDASKDDVVSCASCTTNCLAPVAKVLNDKYGIVRGLMTTVHAYTNDQNILDLPHSDMRRARAAGLSIIPTTTGAAKAVGLVIPELKGKLNGFAMRVPTADVSVVDLTVELKENAADAAEINALLKAASEGELKGVLGYEEKPLVSIDFTGNSNSSIVDPGMTMVLDGNFAKLISWYDNEWGFSCRMNDLAAYMAA